LEKMSMTRRIQPYRLPSQAANANKQIVRSLSKRNRPSRRGTGMSIQPSREATSTNGSRSLDFEAPVKLLATLGLILYVLGLLAVNGYLFRLGMSDFSLLRPRFIYTGTLIASTILLPFLLTVQAGQELVMDWRKPRSTRLLQWATRLYNCGSFIIKACNDCYTTFLHSAPNRGRQRTWH
jgi:hypothetical protein